MGASFPSRLHLDSLGTIGNQIFSVSFTTCITRSHLFHFVSHHSVHQRSIHDQENTQPIALILVKKALTVKRWLKTLAFWYSFMISSFSLISYKNRPIPDETTNKMKFSIVILVTAILALPQSSNTTVSPGERCGSLTGKSCQVGLCCSKFGYCGQSDEYCLIALGCQSDFGLCSSKKPSEPIITPDGTCGGEKGYICRPGFCCSQYGYCGNESVHCDKNCQPLFGICNWIHSIVFKINWFMVKYKYWYYLDTLFE